MVNKPSYNNLEGFQEEFVRNKNKLAAILLLIVFFIIGTFGGIKFLEIKNPVECTGEILSFSSESVPTLQLGHYALWAVNTSGQYSFLKRFNSVDSQLVSLDGSDLVDLDVTLPADADKFVVTIEGEADRDEEPHSFILMESEISDNESLLVFKDITMGDISGQAVLASPTDGNTGINEVSGIWFKDLNSNAASLGIPRLNTQKWKWKATLIYEGENLNIGSFYDPNSADSENKYSLLQPGYNFPGEDFLTNLPDGLTGPLNLTKGGVEIIISLEPQVDATDFTGEDDPFIVVLYGEIPTGNSLNKPIVLDDVFNRPLINLEITKNAECR